MSSAFSASEAIDLLMRLAWSFNGVAKCMGGSSWRVRWGVASACAPWLCLEGWVILGQVEIVGEVEGTEVGSPRHRECGTEVEREVCNTSESFSLSGE